MAYIVDPIDPSQPTGDKGATQGDDELRALKGLVQTLIGGSAVAPVNVFRKNAIIGGDFDTNPWQRGINFVGLATNLLSADRWYRNKTGTMIEDITKTVDAPIMGTVYKNRTMDYFTQNCFQANVTTAQAVLGAGDFSYYYQPVEGYNWKALAQIPIVLSFWHKHTKPGIYCVSLSNDFDRTYVAEYIQVVADTWEFESISIPASPSAGTWNYDTQSGISVKFIRAAGVTSQTATPGIWLNGVPLASVNQTNSVDAINNKFRLALIQLEVGIAASKFERRTFQEELLLCQRYYEKSFNAGIPPTQGMGTVNGEFYFPALRAGALQNISTSYSFKVPKRRQNVLIFTTYNPAVANSQVRDETANVDCAATGVTYSDTGFRITTIGNAATAVGNILGVHWTADNEI
jgi:hypothetical protein